MSKLWLTFLMVIMSLAIRAELPLPAYTAYIEPQMDGANVSKLDGITGWKNPATRVAWFGEFKTNGEINATVSLRLPAGAISNLKLTVGEDSHEATATGAGTNLVRVNFGSFNIATGFQKFQLESLNDAGKSAGDLDALILDGAATLDAHFNLKERRNAASVHLFYPAPTSTDVRAFYCEVTAVDDPIHTFYMACGWHRGYFGMQVISPTERRIIFSVWDSGDEGVDRSKVADTNRVKLLDKGDGVYSGDFGNEGTGGHSHLKFNWKTGEKQRFLVTSRATNETFAVFSGYYFHPDKREWMLISSWRAPRENGSLRGLHSFSENFVGANGQLRRKALYGNQWIQTNTGNWIELTLAGFSFDPTGKADRRDRFMGVEGGQFFLSHGGFVPGFSQFGEKFTRLAIGNEPKDCQTLIKPEH